MDQNNSEYGLFSRTVSLFITFEISSGVTHVKEKAVFLSVLDTIFFNNRDTRKPVVFLNSFFNWIRNARRIENILLINFDSEIRNNVNKEIIKNIC